MCDYNNKSVQRNRSSMEESKSTLPCCSKFMYFSVFFFFVVVVNFFCHPFIIYPSRFIFLLWAELYPPKIYMLKS